MKTKGIYMKKLFTLFFFLFILQLLSAYEQTGIASWYGPNFHGKLTANGEKFNTYDFTAAHRTLPLGSIVKVISLENNKSIIVRINDRGPFAKNRIIDLSMAAARHLDMIKSGTMKVKTILLEKGDNTYHRFSTKQKYLIQVASFSNQNSAEDFTRNLADKNFNVKIKRVKLDKNYFRIIIDDINYSELQLYRVKLHKENLGDYLVIKK